MSTPIFDELIPASDKFPVTNAKYVEGAAITPEMYGAVADGVTDCSSAINTCISENPNSVIVFGKGTYAIGSTINAYGNFGGSELILGGATLKWIGPENGTMMTCNRTKSGATESRCIISGGMFNGNNKAAYGVSLDSYHAYISGSKIFDCKNAHVVVGTIGIDGSTLRSLQVFVENLYIFTTPQGNAAYSNSSRIGILVNEDDNFFSNVNILRMNKAMVLRAHGNEITNSHFTCDYRTALSEPYDAYAVYIQPFSGRANNTNTDDLSNIYFDNYKYCFGASEINRISINCNSSHYFYSGKTTTNSKVLTYMADKYVSYLSCDDFGVITSNECCFLDFYCNGSTDVVKHAYSSQKYIRDINNPNSDAYQTVLAKNYANSGEYINCLYHGKQTSVGKVYEIASILSNGSGLSNIPGIEISYSNRVYGNHKWNIIRDEYNTKWNIVSEESAVPSELGDFFVQNTGTEYLINGTTYTEFKIMFKSRYDGYWGAGFIRFEYQPTVAIYVNHSHIIEVAAGINESEYTKLKFTRKLSNEISDNLIPFPYFDETNVVRENATFTYSSDGILIVNKTQESESSSYFTLYNSENAISLKENQKYTLSINVISGTGKVSAYYAVRKSGTSDADYIDLAAVRNVSAGESKSFTFVYNKDNDYPLDRIGVYVSSTDICSNLKFTVMLESGNEAHEYQPYGLSRQCMKNNITKIKDYINGYSEFVIDETSASAKTVPANVNKFAVVSKICGKTVKEDDTLKSAPIECVVSYGKNLCDGIAHDFVNANGKLVDDSDTSYTYVAQCIPGRTYTISKKGGNRFRIITTNVEPNVGVNTVNVVNLSNNLMSYTYTAGANENYLLAYLGFNDSEPYDVQIEEGTTATAYTQYNKNTISVPDAIKNLPDYGVGISNTVRNYVDFETGKYYRNCKKIKVKDITWSKTTSSSYVLNTYVSGSISDKIIGTRSDIVLMAKYDSKYNKEEFDPTWNKVVYGAGNPANKLTIVDDSITSLADFKTINANEDIIYQLATPEIIDISDIIRPIKCETGGYISLVSEHSFDVANTIIYEKEASL